MKGFLVIETCEDYELPLRLITGSTLPHGGILSWREGNQSAAIFESRAIARAAIRRTEHYRLAYSNSELPESRLCAIIPVESALPQP